MRRFAEVFFLFLLFLSSVANSQSLLKDKKNESIDSILSTRGEAYIGIIPSARKSFQIQLPELAPAKVTDSLIYFFVNKDMFSKILETGLNYQVYTAPSMLGFVKMATSLDEVLNGQAYPTYQQYLDLMERFSNNYPELCKIDTIGYSINGRLILAARLHRGQFKDGERPVVFYSSTMHGNEVIGYSLMLMLINDFLVNSENSPQISSILDDLEVIINPLSNPDGTYFLSDTSFFGNKRSNLNNIDLNRNFHDVRSLIKYTYLGLQKENLAMVKYMEKNRPNMSANFHAGAEVLNYPWDSWDPNEKALADENWFIEICKDYVQTARSTDMSYLQLYPEGYVFGSIWYRIAGGRQDFVTYSLHGREITIELSNDFIPAASQIPDFWTKNHLALIDLIEKARFGVHGTIINSVSANPMKAKIEISGYDKNESYILSNPVTGKFFRYLPEGDYSLTITASGYRSETIRVEVNKKETTNLEVRLIPIHKEILVKTIPGKNDLEITLKDDDSEVFTADLYDLSGRKIQENIFTGSSGTVKGFKAHGIYILKVKSEYQQISRLVFFPFP